MKLNDLLAAHLKEVYEGNNWTDVNIADTIKDVTWQQAQQQTPGSTIRLLHCYIIYIIGMGLLCNG
jgi:hypothetical protein